MAQRRRPLSTAQAAGQPAAAPAGGGPARYGQARRKVRTARTRRCDRGTPQCQLREDLRHVRLDGPVGDEERSATALLDRPSATSARTSRSRGLSSARGSLARLAVHDARRRSSGRRRSRPRQTPTQGVHEHCRQWKTRSLSRYPTRSVAPRSRSAYAGSRYCERTTTPSGVVGPDRAGGVQAFVGVGRAACGCRGRRHRARAPSDKAVAGVVRHPRPWPPPQRPMSRGYGRSPLGDQARPRRRSRACQFHGHRRGAAGRHSPVRRRPPAAPTRSSIRCHLPAPAVAPSMVSLILLAVLDQPSRPLRRRHRASAWRTASTTAR